MKKYIALSAVLAFVLCTADSCSPDTSNKDQQSEAARIAAQSVKFEGNAEIDNIKRRLELTSNPELLGFILLMNQAGQPIYYVGVKGKVTSGSKRLTDPAQVYRNMDHDGIGPAPSDEGTWGESGQYIYFWTINGQYMQWNGDYLYSDKPFHLTVKPLVLDVGSE